MTSEEPACLSHENIFAAVLQLGLGGAALSLDEEFCGGQCRVYKISFLQDPASPNRESLAVRVPLCMYDGDAMIWMLEAEWGTLKTLRDKGFAWSPRPLGCSLSIDNPLKRPFLVLSWGEGSSPQWDDETPSRPLRDKFLSQLAMIHADLIRCTLEDGSATWQSFFERQIRNRRTRVLEGKITGLSEQDCDYQKDLLPRVLDFNGRKAFKGTEMAIDHGDLMPQNIIVDADYNITCVIDWGFSSTVPLPRAAGLPRLFFGPGLSPTAQRDRQTYIAALASLRSPEVTHMPLFPNDKNLEFRTLYLESLFSKGMHLDLAKIGWKVPGCTFLECQGDRKQVADINAQSYS